MLQFLLALQFLVSVALVFVVLLQRSDGGALGIGGGGGGGIFSARSQANLLTKATTWLAAAFFALGIGLAMLSGAGDSLLPEGEGDFPAFPAPSGGGESPIPTFPSLE